MLSKKEQIEVLDLLIQTLKEHEKGLDRISERLEAAAGSLNTIIKGRFTKAVPYKDLSETARLGLEAEKELMDKAAPLLGRTDVNLKTLVKLYTFLQTFFEGYE